MPRDMEKKEPPREPWRTRAWQRDGSARLLPALTLQPAACHRLQSEDDSQSVQTHQIKWLDVSSDSRTLGNDNCANSGSVTDDLGDRLQLKTSSIEPRNTVNTAFIITSLQKESAFKAHPKQPFQQLIENPGFHRDTQKAK